MDPHNGTHVNAQNHDENGETTDEDHEKPKRETHKNTRKRIREKMVETKSPKRPVTSIPPFEDPVSGDHAHKRRTCKQQKKLNSQKNMSKANSNEDNECRNWNS